MDFQDSGCYCRLGFLIASFFSDFTIQIIPIFPTKFRINSHFDSGKVKNRFSRWEPWHPFCISVRNDFSYFWSTNRRANWYQVSIQLVFRCRKRGSKLLFKMAAVAEFSDFWSEIFLLSYLQVNSKFLITFRIKWPFVLGEEVWNRFLRWQPWRPSWISDRTISASFVLQVTPIAPIKLRVNQPFGSGEEVPNRFSR